MQQSLDLFKKFPFWWKTSISENADSQFGDLDEDQFIQELRDGSFSSIYLQF